MAKNKHFGPSLSEFMKTAYFGDVQTSYGSLDDMLTTLKHYSTNKNAQCVFYKDINTSIADRWYFVAFECSHDQMEKLYSNLAVKAVAQMLLRNTLWSSTQKPHFPIKGRPAVIFAWSKLGRQVEYHEMNQYPDAMAVIPHLVNNTQLRVS